MKSFIDKVEDVAQNTPNELGEFNLFALFEREDLYNGYDLVISSDLMGRDKGELYSKIHDAFKAKMTPEELTRFSRFVHLKPTEPLVVDLNEHYPTLNDKIEIRDYRLNNIDIKRGYIFTSQGHVISS